MAANKETMMTKTTIEHFQTGTTTETFDEVVKAFETDHQVAQDDEADDEPSGNFYSDRYGDWC